MEAFEYPRTINLGGLVSTLEFEQAKAVDFIMDTREMRAVPTGRGMLVPRDEALFPGGASQSLELTNYAHGQLADKTGIPKKYYDRMLEKNPELWSQNVNSWFYKEPERRMVRTFGGFARAILSDSYARVDHIDVLKVVLPVFEAQHWQVGECSISATKMHVKATIPSLALPVKTSREVGDIVQAGVIIENSEVGAGALGVKPYLHRLSCKNGMVRSDGAMRRVHLGRTEDVGLLSRQTLLAEDTVFLMKIRDTVNSLGDPDSFAKFVARLEETALIVVERPVEAAEALSKKVGLSEEETDGMLNAFTSGGDPSLWGLVNALTLSAKSTATYERQIELETFAGDIVEGGVPGWRRLLTAAA